jgi:1,4-alpha-glucan branching enzyme
METRYAEATTSGRSVGQVKPRAQTKEAAKAPKAASKAQTVELKIEVPQAKSVSVAGTFNNWDDKKTPLQKDGKGWKAVLPLSPGRYEYKFVVDGQWVCDPKAKEAVQNDFGSSNSVLVV